MIAAAYRPGPGPLEGVSRETLSRLETYLALLAKWNPRINLVGPATLTQAWTRHIVDSAQLLPLLAGRTGKLVDLGSGAGLPGLVLAILGVPEIHLVESDRRKAAFLGEAIRLTGTTGVTVHACRIETVPPFPTASITSRALAPLADLLSLAAPFYGPGTTCYFHKGASWREDLAEAGRSWRFQAQAHASVTDPTSAVLELKEIERDP